MNTMQEQIVKAYQILKATMVEALDAAEQVADIRHTIDFGRNALMLNGKLDGKNEAVREAQAQTELSSEYYALLGAESRQRRTKLQAELARLDVEALRAQLRLMELETAEAA